MRILNQEKKSRKYNKHEKMLVNHDNILGNLMNKMEDLKDCSKEIKLLNLKILNLDKQVSDNNQEIFDDLDIHSKKIINHDNFLNENSNKLEKLEKDNKKLSPLLIDLLEDYELIIQNNNKMVEDFKERFKKIESKIKSNEDLLKSIEQKYIDLNLKLDRNLKKQSLKIENIDISLENCSILSEMNKKNIDIMNNQHTIVKKQIDNNNKEYDNILEEYLKKIQKNKEIISTCLKK